MDEVENPSSAVTVLNDLLLIIFIHGFKGTDDTFQQFPQRLKHILNESISNCQVECIVFPAYETKGDLNEAVVRFADWLTTLTVEKEVASGGGAGKAKIVLCGHSMGGLLAADSLLEFMKSRPDEKAPLWPKIVACIAFDTPYLGVHPTVFKNSVSKAAEYADAAKTVGSALFGSVMGWNAKKATTPAPSQNQARIEAPPPGGWSKWIPAAYAVGGALVAGAAAGGAYYKREDLGLGYTWAVDHMKYIGNLWDEAALKKRLDNLVEAEKKEGIPFRVFYTVLPSVLLLDTSTRTFVVLPDQNWPAFSHFLPARNGNASFSEIDAHTGMFNPKTNDGFYELGLQTAAIIRESVTIGRGTIPEPNSNST